MFHRSILIFFVIQITQSIGYSIIDSNPFKELEKALENNKISLDELLADDSLDKDDNRIRLINSNIMFKKDDSYSESFFHEEPDYDWNAKQMCEFRGFKFEEHKVATQDCYLLEMHRIVNPYDTTPDKKPVLLQHGLIDTSAGWLMNSIQGSINDTDDRNLGFALAKRGYDVWLGNFRGNLYSRNHTNFSAKDPEFWKFTYDNHALQDLPAQIAHIQNVTNYDQIAYVGFSEGTLTMFQLLSLKPEVSKAIKPFIALAPVGYLGQISSPLKYLSRSTTLMRTLLYKNAEFLPNSQFNKIFSSIACRAFPGLICKNILYLICGFGASQLNSTRMPVYFNHLPSGTSLSNLVHFGLNMQSKEFSLLDYMSEQQNLECYNSTTPPLIPVENINITDLYLFNSENDLLADVKDVEKLKKKLKVKFYSRTVELKEFSHVDFILSSKNDYYVNNYLFKVLKEKSPSKSVGSNRKLRFRTFNEASCKVPNKDTRCHMDLKTVLEDIV